MPTSKKFSASKIFNQKGAVQPIAIAIIAVIVIGSIYLLNQKSNKPSTTNSKQEAPKQTQEQTKQEIKDVPDPVNEFLNNNDIGEYKKVGMKIYTGNNPPNIEGLYKSDSLVVFYDKPFKNSAPVGAEVSNYNHKFYDQKSDGTIKVVRISTDGDQASGVGGFISGDNNCFSIFVDVKDDHDQCKADEATIYSACKTESGLENLRAGFILKDMEGPGCNKTVPIGHLRIITEDDGLAERIEE